MQQAWEWQQPPSTVQPATHPQYTWDAWQVDSQVNNTNCGENYPQQNIYPPTNYTATTVCQTSCHCDLNTPQQDTWQLGVNGNASYSTATYSASSLYPTTYHAGADVYQPVVYSNLNHQIPYQQDAWQSNYVNTDGTHHIQSSSEHVVYPSNSLATTDVVQTAECLSADQTYLDLAEQQRKIEHAQYLISRWGTSDETEQECSPYPAGQSSVSAYSCIQPPPHKVDQNKWIYNSTVAQQQQCRWTYTSQPPKEVGQRLNVLPIWGASRGHGCHAQEAPAAQDGPKVGECGKRTQRWTPKEFIPEVTKDSSVSALMFVETEPGERTIAVSSRWSTGEGGRPQLRPKEVNQAVVNNMESTVSGLEDIDNFQSNSELKSKMYNIKSMATDVEDNDKSWPDEEDLKDLNQANLDGRDLSQRCAKEASNQSATINTGPRVHCSDGGKFPFHLEDTKEGTMNRCGLKVLCVEDGASQPRLENLEAITNDGNPTNLCAEDGASQQCPTKLPSVVTSIAVSQSSQEKLHEADVGKCNLEVACCEGEQAWQNEFLSPAIYSAISQLCSGTLKGVRLNNCTTKVSCAGGGKILQSPEHGGSFVEFTILSSSQRAKSAGIEERPQIFVPSDQVLATPSHPLFQQGESISPRQIQDKMQKYEVSIRAQFDGAVGALLEKHQEFPNQHMPCDIQQEKQTMKIGELLRVLQLNTTIAKDEKLDARAIDNVIMEVSLPSYNKDNSLEEVTSSTSDVVGKTFQLRVETRKGINCKGSVSSPTIDSIYGEQDFGRQTLILGVSGDVEQWKAAKETSQKNNPDVLEEFRFEIEKLTSNITKNESSAPKCMKVQEKEAENVEANLNLDTIDTQFTVGRSKVYSQHCGSIARDTGVLLRVEVVSEEDESLKDMASGVQQDDTGFQCVAKLFTDRDNQEREAVHNPAPVVGNSGSNGPEICPIRNNKGYQLKEHQDDIQRHNTAHSRLSLVADFSPFKSEEHNCEFGFASTDNVKKGSEGMNSVSCELSSQKLDAGAWSVSEGKSDEQSERYLCETPSTCKRPSVATMDDTGEGFVNESGPLEVNTSATASLGDSGGTSGCPQPHPVGLCEQLNLEESISFGLCEETPSLQEMLESRNGCERKQFVVEIPPIGAKVEGESSKRREIEDDSHVQRPSYGCSQRFTPSPLNLVESHGFQQDVEGQTINEMLETTFQSGSHDFVDDLVTGDSHCKGGLSFEGREAELFGSSSCHRRLSEGLIQGISRRDLQQVIIKQLDLEESHLFAESIEDHGSKEMQESPVGSEGQDFLDEIMTSEGEGKEETAPGAGQMDIHVSYLEEQRSNDKRKIATWQVYRQHLPFEQRDMEGSHALGKNLETSADVNRKRKPIYMPCESSSDWDSKHGDKFGGFQNRFGCCKQRVDPLFSVRGDSCRNQNTNLENYLRKVQSDLLSLERLQTKDFSLWRDSSFGNGSDHRLRCKAGAEVSGTMHNNEIFLIPEKTPHMFERSNEEENNFVGEVLLGSTDRWPYGNRCEGTRRSEQGTVVSAALRPSQADDEGESPETAPGTVEVNKTLNCNRLQDTQASLMLTSKVHSCGDYTDLSAGWVYHTTYGSISGVYTLEQLQRGLAIGFLPADLPVYQVQAGIYTGPFALNLVTEKTESLSACVIDHLQQPMLGGKKPDYAQVHKNLTPHTAGAIPFYYGHVPVVTTAWPISISGSPAVERAYPGLDLGSPSKKKTLPTVSEGFSNHCLHTDGTQWRAVSTPPEAYQHSGACSLRDNLVPAQGKSLHLEMSGVVNPFAYPGLHLERPWMNFYSPRSGGYQTTYQNFPIQHGQLRAIGNMQIHGNNGMVFQGQICHLGTSIEPVPLENLLILAEKGTLFNQSLPQHYSFSEQGGENSTCDSSLLKDPRVIALDFVQQKLHAAILDAACKGFIDAIIRHTLQEEGSASKPILVLVKQPIEPKESLPSSRTGRSPAISAKALDEENTQQPEQQNLSISQKRPAQQNYDDPATTTRPGAHCPRSRRSQSSHFTTETDPLSNSTGIQCRPPIPNSKFIHGPLPAKRHNRNIKTRRAIIGLAPDKIPEMQHTIATQRGCVEATSAGQHLENEEKVSLFPGQTLDYGLSAQLREDPPNCRSSSSTDTDDAVPVRVRISREQGKSRKNSMTKQMGMKEIQIMMRAGQVQKDIYKQVETRGNVKDKKIKQPFDSLPKALSIQFPVRGRGRPRKVLNPKVILQQPERQKRPILGTDRNAPATRSCGDTSKTFQQGILEKVGKWTTSFIESVPRSSDESCEHPPPYESLSISIEHHAVRPNLVKLQPSVASTTVKRKAEGFLEKDVETHNGNPDRHGKPRNRAVMDILELGAGLVPKVERVFTRKKTLELSTVLRDYTSISSITTLPLAPWRVLDPLDELTKKDIPITHPPVKRGRGRPRKLKEVKRENLVETASLVKERVVDSDPQRSANFHGKRTQRNGLLHGNKAVGCARSSISGWAWRSWARNGAKQRLRKVLQGSVSLEAPLRMNVNAISSLQSARTNRATLRKLVSATEGSDKMKFNQLKARKKQLKFQRSKIHDWGLLALEPIDAEDFVIEYVGEIIRRQVSDLRERQYETMGIGSSYLFRVDDELVVDATRRGGLARFINHSCDMSRFAELAKGLLNHQRTYVPHITIQANHCNFCLCTRVPDILQEMDVTVTIIFSCIYSTF